MEGRSVKIVSVRLNDRIVQVERFGGRKKGNAELTFPKCN